MNIFDRKAQTTSSTQLLVRFYCQLKK